MTILHANVNFIPISLFFQTYLYDDVVENWNNKNSTELFVEIDNHAKYCFTTAGVIPNQHRSNQECSEA